MKEYCPDCIVELEPKKKRLGQFINWLVCPLCGFRKRQDHDNILEVGQFCDELKRRNMNLNEFNEISDETR